jgi:hypothetical protein
MIKMIIHIEYIQATRKWILTIDGIWLITAESFDLVAARLIDYIPAIGRVARAS